MFFNVVFAVLVAYAIVAPCIFIKFGMRIATKDEDVAETPIFNVPAAKKKPKLTPQQDRDMQIMANIARYNGTSFGQKKVEVK